MIPQTRIVGHNEFGLPALSFHAQDYTAGSPDFSHMGTANSKDLAKYWRESPMIGRLVAYGKQLSPFDYTQKPGHSQFPGGTADGRRCICRPKSGLSTTIPT